MSSNASASSAIASKPEPTSTPALSRTSEEKESSEPGGSSNANEPEYVTGPRLVFLIGSVTIVAFILLLDQSILSTAIPQITSSFHSLPDVGWYSGAYQLGCAVLQPLTGKLYTHLRNKHVFLAHLALFELGSLICATATSSSMLIGGRAIAGLGGAGLMNGALAIIANSTPLEKRPFYTGIIIGTAQMGLVSGPLIGGAFTEKATWRWFYINLPIGAVCAAIIALVRIPDLATRDPYSLALFRKIVPQLDLPGFVLFAPACIMFLLALQFGGDGTHPWNSAMVIGLLVGAGVTIIIFGIWEARVGDQAMIPGMLFKNRIALASSGQTVGLMMTVLVGSTWLPIYFQAVRGASPVESGVDLLPTILSQLVFAVGSGFLVSKLGYYLPWAVFSGIVTAVGNGLFTTLDASTSTARWIGFLIVSGSGRGAGMQMALIAVQAALPASLIPTAITFLIFVQNLSGSIAVIIANTIFTQTLISKLPQYAPSVSPDDALAAGGSAGAVRALVLPGHEGELTGVLNAYSESLRNVWYLLVGMAVVQFACAWGTGWIDVRKKKAEDVKSGETVGEKGNINNGQEDKTDKAIEV